MLQRETLFVRLKLELTMMVGLRKFVTSATMFVLVIIASSLNTAPSPHQGLQRILVENFELDTLAEISTLGAFKEYMQAAAGNSRELSPLSSSNFVTNDPSELNLVPGLQKFSEVETISVEEVQPLIASSFTFTAWVRSPSSTGAPAPGVMLVRKPLAQSEAQGTGATTAAGWLSCWGWQVGAMPRFYYGAHDFGGDMSPACEDNVLTVECMMDAAHGAATNQTISAWTDGQWHFHAVTITQTQAHFSVDGAKTSTVGLRRPVTDCTGGSLDFGSAGLRAPA